MKPSLILLWASVLAIAGCATHERNALANGLPTATCHVCRYNNDLACIRVQVRDTTPSCEYNGQTYYFCSETCRTDFLKRPAKYLPK